MIRLFKITQGKTPHRVFSLAGLERLQRDLGIRQSGSPVVTVRQPGGATVMSTSHALSEIVVI
jgi:hypothetical protein